MIGTAWHRRKGMQDPVLARLVRAMGRDEVPLFEAEPADVKERKRGTRALGRFRDGPVDARRIEVSDPAAMADRIKRKAAALGADATGIARLRPMMIDLRAELTHEFVVALIVREDFEKVMDGAAAVEREAYRVYRACAEISNRLAAFIREELGWPALAHHNGGSEIQAIPVLYHAGLGELGKHGSLIHPEFAADFRPGFVTTSLPMACDSPRHFGVQDRCLGCRVCINNCPGDAIPDAYIETDGVKRWITDVVRCYPYSRLAEDYCHLCVDVCPYNAAQNRDTYRDTYKAFMRSRKRDGYRDPRHGTAAAE